MSDGKYLDQISTRWTDMEALAEEEGPKAVADYLAARYYKALTLKFKRHVPNISDDDAYELTQELFLQLLKNDYQGIKKINRDRGHLRGLFSTIIKRTIIDKVYRNKSRNQQNELENLDQACIDRSIDICLDIQVTLERMEKERPLLHDAFDKIYIKGQSRSDYVEENSQSQNLDEDEKKKRSNALYQRLLQARRWLAGELREYDEET